MTHVLRRLPPIFGRRSGWHLISAQVLLAVLVTLITGAAVLSYDRMVRKSVENQMQNTADLAEIFLNQENAGVAAVIASTMQAGDVNAALLEPGSARSKLVIQRTLDILSASGTDISSVAVTSADGKLISSIPMRVPAGFDLSDRPWFRQARASRSFAISPVFESLAVKDRYLTTISVPVRLQGPDSQLLGVVSVAEKLDGYQRFVDVYSRHRNVRLSVIDGSGAVVAAGGTGIFPSATPLTARLAAGRKLLSPSHDEITAVGISKAQQASENATGDDWRVVSQVSRKSAMHPATIFRVVAVAAGLLILLASLLITWIRRRAWRASQNAARQLAQSELQMHDLANSSPHLLFRLTADGVAIFGSKSSQKLLGRAPEDLIGQDLLALVEAEQAPDAHARLQTLVRDGEPQFFVARTTGEHGGRRIVECSLRLGRSEEVTEVWGSLEDVTDRRSASDQVEQLFQLSEDFMAVLDFHGLLVQTNPVWTAAFEVSKEHLLGTRFEQSFEPEDHEAVTAELARLVSVQGVATFETRYRRAGVTRTLLWTAGSDPDRRLIYAVGRDISDHKELQHALSETRDQALEASRLKSEFVATMSHEIRTPMNGVIGLTDLLLGTPLDATQRRYVEGVRIAGDALLSVINDILDFSKIEAGRMVLDSIDFRLEDVVEDVATLVRQSANAKGLELTVEFQVGVPFALNGDPGRLRQVLLNVAHNAVKFTDQGGVSVRVQPGEPRPDGRVPVIFKVIDTGIGMDPAQLEELFEPFRQAHEGATRAYGGTGLGLSICRRLADLMGGRLHAVSELGRGATFELELVFAPAADWGRSVRGPDARGLAVLVVDDDEVNRLVMITQLSRWGMRPVAAGSAVEALELLTMRSAPAGGYDLAVIDMHMPETDGFGLVKKLRTMPALRRLPVILLTSDHTIDSEVAQQYRISARLTKPVQQSDLFDALTRVAMPSAFTGTRAPGSVVPGSVVPGSVDSGSVVSGSAVGAEPVSAAGPPAAPAVRIEPVRAEPVQTEHARSEPVRAVPVRAEVARAEPVRVEPARPAPVPAASTSASRIQPRSPADDVPFQLLLVEDNDINQTVALGILTQLGYQVDVAGDGIQAVTMAGQHAYDAILMDCQMPRLDGYAATIQLRKQPATRTTPIIAMTAATFAADRQRCFDSGMDDFIAKPVRAATLQATLNRWLGADPPVLAPENLVLEPLIAERRVTERRSSDRSERGPIPEPRAGTRSDQADTETVAAGPVRTAGADTTNAADAVVADTLAADTSAAGSVLADTEQRIHELLGEGSQLEVEMVRDIISSFLSRTVDLLQRLTLAVAADDAESALLHAHSMAGAGLNLGTVQVVMISRQIEADAKAGRPALSVPRLVELEVALDRARIVLRDLAVNLPHVTVS